MVGQQYTWPVPLMIIDGGSILSRATAIVMMGRRVETAPYQARSRREVLFELEFDWVHAIS